MNAQPRLLAAPHQELVEDLGPSVGVQCAAVGEDAVEVEDACGRGRGQAEHRRVDRERRQPGRRPHAVGLRDVGQKLGRHCAFANQRLSAHLSLAPSNVSRLASSARSAASSASCQSSASRSSSRRRLATGVRVAGAARGRPRRRGGRARIEAALIIGVTLGAAVPPRIRRCEEARCGFTDASRLRLPTDGRSRASRPPSCREWRTPRR